MWGWVRVVLRVRGCGVMVSLFLGRVCRFFFLMLWWMLSKVFLLFMVFGNW